MNIAVILISGKGTRMGNNIPKQFILVKNKPLYLYALNAFYINKKIDRLLVVTNPEHVSDVKKDISKYGYNQKPISVISGGNERYLSVINAIKALDGYNVDDNILIHDGVRPNVNERIINQNINGLNLEPCALTAIKVKSDYHPTERVDTIHFLNNEQYRAQTPQSFKLGVLRDIYRRGLEYKPYPFTDDISLSIACCYPYIIIDGEESNYKITRQEDLERFIKEKK